MQIHFYAMVVLALCVAAGLFYRLATILLWLGYTYVFLLEQTAHQNHQYLCSLVLFLMIFLPAHRALSVDAWLRPRLRSDSAPAWTLWLLRAQFAIVYFYAGLAKLNPDWLGGQVMRLYWAGHRDMPWLGGLASHEGWVYFFTYGGLCFDLLVVPALLWKVTRPYAFVLAVSFHLANATIFGVHNVFPWLMMAATALYFAPDWPQRLLGRVGPVSRGTAPSSPLRRGAILTMLGVYLTMQLLVPLRHHLYPGNALWTDEGIYFSWQMLSRHKIAETWFMAGDSVQRRLVGFQVPDSAEGRALALDPNRARAAAGRLADQLRREGHANVQVQGQARYIRFHITDPVSGNTWMENAQLYLSASQLQQMVKEPDMILQFSHYLANLLRSRRNLERVEVRVEAWISLNGRKHQLMIDPSVDLVGQNRSWSPAPWILPLTEPLPGVPAREDGPELEQESRRTGEQ